MKAITNEGNMKIEWPKRNTRFKLEDYHQTDVDEFHDGLFMFLSAKMIDIKSSPLLWEMIESHDEKGWVISTYSYTNKSFEKILVCGYKSKPWMNRYHIEAELGHVNECYGCSVIDTVEDFIDWMESPC